MKHDRNIYRNTYKNKLQLHEFIQDAYCLGLVEFEQAQFDS